jgi:hypothetical protein
MLTAAMLSGTEVRARDPDQQDALSALAAPGMRYQIRLPQVAAGDRPGVPSTTPWPRQPLSALPLKVPTLVLGFFPRDPTNPDMIDVQETGTAAYKVDDLVANMFKMVQLSQTFLLDATRYHGYKDATAPSFLSFPSVDTKIFYTPMPRGYLLPNNGTYRPHYRSILDGINICDYVDRHGVREIWIYAYHNPHGGIEPVESKMSGPTGDVSNSEREPSSQYALPLCSHTYTLYTFGWGIDSETSYHNNIHNRMHQIENLLFFSENRGYPAYAGSPTKPGNTTGSVFWDSFSQYIQSWTTVNNGACGNTHFAANWLNVATEAYRYNSTVTVRSDCEDWHPDKAFSIYKQITCLNWGCTDIGFFKWFMQNMPGYGNGIIYQGKQMRNWWEAMYDFDEFISRGRSLWEP